MAALEDLLAAWLPHQRWYPLKGAAGVGARPAISGSFELASPHPSLTLLVLLVSVELPSSTTGHDAGPRLTLQVPLSFYRDGTAVLSELVAPGGLLGELSAGDGWPGGRVHDGLADPNFLRAWLAETVGGGTPHSGSGGDARPTAARLQEWRNAELEGLAGAAVSDIRVLSAEQSNSSVIFRLEGRALIAKFFRILHAGEHPEVEIGRALAGVAGTLGKLNVPALQAAVGYGEADTTLFVVHDFIAGGQDGWALALATAGSGTDFSAQARAIGAALANVHHALREGMGAHLAESSEAAAFTRAIAARLEWAWGLASPAVGSYDGAFQNILTQLSQIESVQQVQRIHGDLHLGQLLYRDAAGAQEWFILDFEGEPLRPLADRGHPDVALRDIVGMLRSFDYAGAQAAANGAVTKEQGTDWANASAKAFIEGYENASGERISRNSALFVALWLDKALYEVVYELQNRPSWAWVPVQAVQHLFESRESDVAWD